MKYLLVLIALFNQSISLCGEGCIRCSKLDYCEMCDVQGFYIMKDGNCQKIAVKNCYEIDYLGKCVSCVKNHFLDPETQFCIAVTEQKRIDNCYKYNSQMNCIQCDKDTYLLNNTCIPVAQKIIGCIGYATNNTCSICEVGFQQFEGTCVYSEIPQYCQFYSKIQCRQCMDGYFLDFNKPSSNLFTFNSSEEIENVSKVLFSELYSHELIYQQPYSFCRKIHVENCAEYESSTQCKTCMDNFTLTDDQQCRPKFLIPNCKTYDVDNKCIECAPNHFIGINECTPIIPILNCKTYKPTANTTVCLECEENFILDLQKCKVRKTIVQNCQKHGLLTDTCQLCEYGYVLSTDHLQCFEGIRNCMTHNPDVSSAEGVQCLQCDDYYFPQNGRCFPGLIENCLVYQSQLMCQQCKNEFYQSGGKCLSVTRVLSCEQYHPTKDQCLKCNQNFYNFLIKTQCERFDHIENCARYTDNMRECLECNPYFQLDSTNLQCTFIGLDHCLQKNDEGCVKCDLKFYRQKIGNQIKCLPTDIQFNQSCLESNLDELQLETPFYNEVQCNSCQINFYPTVIQSVSKCFQKEFLERNFQINLQNKYYCSQINQQGQCTKCVQNYYLTKDFTCQQNCPNAFLPLQFIQNSDQYITNNNICSDEIIDQCLILGPSNLSFKKNNEQQNICLQCKENILPLIDLNSPLVWSSMNSSIQRIENPIDQFLPVQCPILKESDTLYGQTVKDPIPNCELYFITSINGVSKNIGCLKCKQFYVGSPNLQGSIDNCISVDFCSNKKIYGLDAIWQSLLSCHKCKTWGEIPFLVMKTIAQDKPIPQNYSPYILQEPWIMDQNLELQNIQCLPPAASSLGFQDFSKFYFPGNCAAGFINLRYVVADSTNSTQQINGESIQKLAVFCIACNPGYSATSINEIYPFIKIQCNQIKNCKESTSWFNYCSNCKDGYMYELIDNEIYYDRCVESKTVNCEAGIVKNQTPVCLLCKKGFNLIEGQCIQIEELFCDNPILVPQKFPLNQLSLMFYTQQGLGCQSCSQSFISQQIESLNIQCVKADSEFYQNKKNSVDPNCQMLSFIFNELICKECNEGFAVMQSTGKCGLKMNNCITQKTEQECLVCDEGYGNVKNKCVFGDIPYCNKYNNSDSQMNLQCRECQSGYVFMKNCNCCQQSNVEDCEIGMDNDLNNCVKCKDDFLLVDRSSNDYCFPLPSNLNCLKPLLFLDENDILTITCSACKQQYALKQLTSNFNNQCLFFKEIPYCKKYNESDNLMKEKFACILCEDPYYVDSKGSCTPRRNSIENCDELKINDDGCSKCEEDYVVTGNTCTLNKSGILNCEQIQDQTCIRCTKQHYLENNHCFHVDLKNQIPNCEYYESDQECFSCTSNYLLDDGKCFLIEAKNCLSYKDFQNCSYCPDGYGLQKNQLGNMDCIKMESRKCQSFENSIDFACKTCENGFYPNEKGLCEEIKLEIPNCIQYDGPNTCARCGIEYILDVDHKECIDKRIVKDQQDPFCSFNVMKMNCVICQSGAYFYKNECVLCPQSEGCFKCDSNNPWQCMMCSSGWSMNKEGICKKNIQIKMKRSGVNILSLWFGLLFLIQIIIMKQSLVKISRLVIFT